MNEWISVKDAVPSYNIAYVFVFVKETGEVAISEIETYLGKDYPNFQNRSGVTHWKHIEFPEPPKDE